MLNSQTDRLIDEQARQNGHNGQDEHGKQDRKDGQDRQIDRQTDRRTDRHLKLIIQIKLFIVA